MGVGEERDRRSGRCDLYVAVAFTPGKLLALLHPQDLAVEPEGLVDVVDGYATMLIPVIIAASLRYAPDNRASTSGVVPEPARPALRKSSN